AGERLAGDGEACLGGAAGGDRDGLGRATGDTAVRRYAAELHRVAARREAGHGYARTRSDILARPAVDAEGVAAGRVSPRRGRTDCEATGQRLAGDSEARLGSAAAGDSDGLGRATGDTAVRRYAAELHRVAARREAGHGDARARSDILARP